MRHATALLFALLLVAPCFADSVDDAEAKRRGVSVEVVQLEAAKAKIAALEKQIASMQSQIKTAQQVVEAANAQIESLKSQIAAAPKPPADKPVKVGMKRSEIPSTFRSVATNNERETMEWIDTQPGSINDGGGVKITWTITLDRGVVTNVASEVGRWVYSGPVATPSVRMGGRASTPVPVSPRR